MRRGRLTFGDPRHGTPNGYINYGCRCDECRAANARHNRKMRQQRTLRLKAGEVDVPHGRNSTYVNYGCRCVDCTAAHATDLREYFQRRRAAS